MQFRAWKPAAILLGAAVCTIGLACAGRMVSPPELPSGSVDWVEVTLQPRPGGGERVVIRSTDLARIETLAEVMRRGVAVEEHKCAATGEIRFRGKDGSVVLMSILPGHDRRFYEYRTVVPSGAAIFRVDRPALQRAMDALGAGMLDPGGSES